MGSGFSSSSWMITGPVQHFYSSILDVSVFLLSFLTGRAFGGIEYYLPRPTCGNEIRRC